MEELNEMFYQKPYLKAYDSTAVSCVKKERGWHVILKDTIFYPEGGGQPGDTGTLNHIPVIDTVRNKDGEIEHICTEEIPAGTPVHGVLDWDSRFEHMQLHTGEHIVSGLIHQKFGYENVGFHMGKVIQIDFDGSITGEELREIEYRANAVVSADMALDISYPSKEQLAHMEYRSKKELTGRVRIVTIPQTDVCACCGTHVKRTGEVGLIKILHMEKHKNGVRIFMLAGKKALDYVMAVCDENDAVSHLLSVPVEETSAGVKALYEEKKQAEYRAGELTRKLLEKKAEDVEAHSRLVIFKETGIDRNTLRKYAVDLTEKKDIGICVMLNQEADRKISYLIYSESTALRPYIQTLNTKLNGRGGGKDDLIQGSFAADIDTCEKTIREVFADVL